jgi:phenylacetic acid degradation operon negative regulatory protein
MTSHQRIDAAIADILGRANPRAPSLIVSVLGDSIAPHGGSFWIGSMIKLMEPLGLNARLVRTAIFRLTKEGWLRATQRGRQSYYRLTESGLRRFEAAFHRVYDDPQETWDGAWTLAMLDTSGMSSDERDQIRKEMAWSGFGMAAPSVFVHTSLSAAELSAKLAELGIQDHTVTMTARLTHASQGGNAAAFARRCWDLDTLAAGYHQFLALFQPLMPLFQEIPPTPTQAFMARTLLIHEYRRVSLRDPHLPAALLSADWEGRAARVLAKNLYRMLDEPTERHLLSVVETADGPLPPADASYAKRFDGV